MQAFFGSSLLIAMPALQDQHFNKAVCLLCSHSSEGAMGIVINHPLSVSVQDLLKELSISSNHETLTSKPVLNGGPVGSEQGFIIHDSRENWDATLPVNDAISLTTSVDILEQCANEEPPFNLLVALGYAGWGPGQLESEIADNAWLLAPVSSKLLFDTPHNEQWMAAGREIGVDLNLLPNFSGHG